MGRNGVGYRAHAAAKCRNRGTERRLRADESAVEALCAERLVRRPPIKSASSCCRVGGWSRDSLLGSIELGFRPTQSSSASCGCDLRGLDSPPVIRPQSCVTSSPGLIIAAADCHGQARPRVACSLLETPFLRKPSEGPVVLGRGCRGCGGCRGCRGGGGRCCGWDGC